MKVRSRSHFAWAGLGLAGTLLGSCAADVIDAPGQSVTGAAAALSSSSTSYLQGLARGVTFTPLLSVGDSVNNKPDGTPYRMVGIPDGLGAFDNDDGTFTVLMNHELTATVGTPRAHGAKGAFVSKWTIDKDTLEVLEGADLIQAISTYNATTQTWNAPAQGIALGRLCSADLADKDAFFNKRTKKGHKGHIFLNGEETGTEGRALAHIVDGDAAGLSYELPHLGKFSWENSVANPDTGDLTLVAGLDDTGNGQVYFYLGQKSKTGTAIDKAGLTGGTLYALQLTGIPIESDATVLAPSQTFSLVSLGNVAAMTGAELQTATVAAGATGFQRPEDGSWNPDDPREFYFVTTASFTNKTRMWRVRFNDINNPTAGGKVELLVDGGEPRMLDNMTVERKGRFAVMQEDPGLQDHIAKLWRFDLRENELKAIAQFDPDRFGVPAGPNFMTTDEESSGVIDVSKILGNGYYLLDAQVHLANSDPELVEHGQLLLMRVPNRLR
jgi:hypothetical protein